MVLKGEKVASFVHKEEEVASLVPKGEEVTLLVQERGVAIQREMEEEIEQGEAEEERPPWIEKQEVLLQKGEVRKQGILLETS